MIRRPASPCTIILLTLLALSLLFRPDPSLSETVPPLTITPASHDFGFMSLGSTSSPAVFTITNNSPEAQTISRIDLAKRGDFILNLTGGENPCGQGTPALEPGENCTVTVSFRPFTMGQVNSSLRIKTTDSGRVRDSNALLKGFAIACGC